MKLFAFLVIIGVSVAFIGCSWFDKYNDIEYPASFEYECETIGDSNSLGVHFNFRDQTPDSSGVIFEWKRIENGFWFSLKGGDAELVDTGSYSNYIGVYLGELDKGDYFLIFEGSGNDPDTHLLRVEDSVYLFEGEGGKWVILTDKAKKGLRRIFPDMLLVEVGMGEPIEEQNMYLDSLNQEFISVGAEECTVPEGQYSMFYASSDGDVIGNLFTKWADYDSVFEHGWLCAYKCLLFVYNEDTIGLESIFEKYSADKFPSLSIHMGNGYWKLYEIWND